jgi:hypothetical protein
MPWLPCPGLERRHALTGHAFHMDGAGGLTTRSTRLSPCGTGSIRASVAVACPSNDARSATLRTLSAVLVRGPATCPRRFAPKATMSRRNPSGRR